MRSVFFFRHIVLTCIISAFNFDFNLIWFFASNNTVIYDGHFSKQESFLIF